MKKKAERPEPTAKTNHYMCIETRREELMDTLRALSKDTRDTQPVSTELIAACLITIRHYEARAYEIQTRLEAAETTTKLAQNRIRYWYKKATGKKLLTQRDKDTANGVKNASR